MIKTIITGVTGQDGSYLAQQLLEKGHKVIGLTRNSTPDLSGLNYLGVKDDVEIKACDLENKSLISKILFQEKPNYIYHLAAESSVAESFKNPHNSIIFNLKSTLNLLEAIRETDLDIRLYQATSSEMYGSVASLPINENTLLHPQSPYAISKAACHFLVRNYRESYNIQACSGILFNHESVLRRKNFFIMKLMQNALDIKYKKIKSIQFGNLDIMRDFGYAPKYVEAMVLMLEAEKLEDFIICSGTSISLRSIVHHVFDRLNIDYKHYSVDEHLFRPSEIQNIYGDNTKAKQELNWKYDFSFYEILDILLEDYETNIYKK